MVKQDHFHYFQLMFFLCFIILSPQRNQKRKGDTFINIIIITYKFYTVFSLTCSLQFNPTRFVLTKFDS